MVNKTCILDKIKEFYGLKSNKALSEFLGVTKQTISNWYSRNTIDYDIVLAKCKDVDLHWLLLGTTEKPINTRAEDNRDFPKRYGGDMEEEYQIFKSFNGMSSLYNYLINRYNYSDTKRVTDNISGSVEIIFGFIADNHIWNNFYKLYDSFEYGQISKEKLLSEFEGLIVKDKKVYSLLNRYETVLNEISNSILDDKFPNQNYFFDENGDLRK